MAISRMLKMQLIGHASVREEVKRMLRESGVVEVTDASMEEPDLRFDAESVREVERLLGFADAALDFLDGFADKPTLLERLSAGPIRTSRGDAERLSRETPLESIWSRCVDIDNEIRSTRDELARSGELVRGLEAWGALDASLDALRTGHCEAQLWAAPEKRAEEDAAAVGERHPYAHFEECSRSGARSYVAVIVHREEEAAVGEELKELGWTRSVFAEAAGRPAELAERERARQARLETALEEALERARALLEYRDRLRILSDYYRERRGLVAVERHFHRTDSTFLLEGWVRAVDRRRLEKDLASRVRDITLSFREAREDEEPPVALANRPIARPYEFVLTLYGRPVYNEIDPTPLLAPFFIVFFALCLTDGGYGMLLAGISAVLLWKLKPAGGAGKLLRLLLMGGIVTIVAGLLTGGVFGIEIEALPAAMRSLVFINPLEEPMTMLNIAFLIGVVHILFGIGIKMVADFRAGLVADAVFDDLFWIVFLIALAPLGFSAVLGGEVPAGVILWSRRISLVAAAGIFLTGGRKQKGIVKKLFKGIVGFYSVVGYFGDVLSYARLLALGLATSAIALAVNGIAGMVDDLPYYTGPVASVLVLILGHGFNLAVNTLGAFVHSGRLQYLEFFSKFFTGGGREFRPFRSERRYSMLVDTEG